MTSPLPPGIRFWIATGKKHYRPRFAIEVDGVKVRLSRIHGEVMMHLLAHPGRHWFTGELARAVYGNQEDGGPLTASKMMSVIMFNLRSRLRRFGVEMEMADCPSGHQLSRLYLDPACEFHGKSKESCVSRLRLAVKRRRGPVRDRGHTIQPEPPCYSSPHDAPWHIPNRLEQAGAVIVGGVYEKPPPKVPRRQPRVLKKATPEYREPVRTGKWTMPERIEAKGGWKP